MVEHLAARRFLGQFGSRCIKDDFPAAADVYDRPLGEQAPADLFAQSGAAARDENRFPRQRVAAKYVHPHPPSAAARHVGLQSKAKTAIIIM